MLLMVSSASTCEWAGQDYGAGACLAKPVHPQQGPISSYVCPQLPYDERAALTGATANNISDSGAQFAKGVECNLCSSAEIYYDGIHLS